MSVDSPEQTVPLESYTEISAELRTALDRIGELESERPSGILEADIVSLFNTLQEVEDFFTGFNDDELPTGLSTEVTAAKYKLRGYHPEYKHLYTYGQTQENS